MGDWFRDARRLTVLSALVLGGAVGLSALFTARTIRAEILGPEQAKRLLGGEACTGVGGPDCALKLNVGCSHAGCWTNLTTTCTPDATKTWCFKLDGPDQQVNDCSDTLPKGNCCAVGSGGCSAYKWGYPQSGPQGRNCTFYGDVCESNIQQCGGPIYAIFPCP